MHPTSTRHGFTLGDRVVIVDNPSFPPAIKARVGEVGTVVSGTSGTFLTVVFDDPSLGRLYVYPYEIALVEKATEEATEPELLATRLRPNQVEFTIDFDSEVWKRLPEAAREAWIDSIMDDLNQSVYVLNIRRG